MVENKRKIIKTKMRREKHGKEEGNNNKSKKNDG